VVSHFINKEKQVVKDEEARSSRRKPVFAMKVRFRRATQLDFEEHHASDVSTGGTFVKTPHPLPPGTLLKLELKLAAEPQPIHGVGRVVWTRQPGGQVDQHPAGMGIKFIKLDELSKKAIRRLA
jgi:uncharacterized protein (TIGR02266 family)